MAQQRNQIHKKERKDKFEEFLEGKEKINVGLIEIHPSFFQWPQDV